MIFHYQKHTVLNYCEYNCTTLIKTIIAKLFLKYIWDSRNRHSLPNFLDAKNTITSDLLTLVNSGNSIRRNFNDSGLAQKFLQGWNQRKTQTEKRQCVLLLKCTFFYTYFIPQKCRDPTSRTTATAGRMAGRRAWRRTRRAWPGYRATPTTPTPTSRREPWTPPR